MKTRITVLLGIQHTIIQVGLHYLGYAEVAADVTDAGALGIRTGRGKRTPQDLANEIARCAVAFASSEPSVGTRICLNMCFLLY